MRALRGLAAGVAVTLLVFPEARGALFTTAGVVLGLAAGAVLAGAVLAGAVLAGAALSGGRRR